MKIKATNFAVSVVFLVLAINAGLQAVNTREIERVRCCGVLVSGDLQVIDDFVAEAVRELVKTRDFTSTARVRAVILSRSKSTMDSAAVQYAEQFFASANKYISEALKKAEMLTPEDRKFKTILNLLILVDNLEDVRLANLAMKMLNSESTVIRYWAVHSVTNPGIIEELNSANPANLKLAEAIVERLRELVDSSGPEIIALIAKFAAKVQIRQGEDLLGQIADMRISKYANWTVDYELLDAAILKMLCRKIAGKSRSLPPTGRDRSAIARRFGQLYSYAMQRYINDVKGGDFLSAAQRHQLASVLVETEKSCISRILNRPQSTVRKAVERGDVTALLLEHSRLLGGETRAGRLALKLKFDYGTNPGGDKRTAPLALPERPKELIIDY